MTDEDKLVEEVCLRLDNKILSCIEDGGCYYTEVGTAVTSNKIFRCKVSEDEVVYVNPCDKHEDVYDVPGWELVK